MKERIRKGRGLWAEERGRKATRSIDTASSCSCFCSSETHRVGASETVSFSKTTCGECKPESWEERRRKTLVPVSVQLISYYSWRNLPSVKLSNWSGIRWDWSNLNTNLSKLGWKNLNSLITDFNGPVCGEPQPETGQLRRVGWLTGFIF